MTNNGSNASVRGLQKDLLAGWEEAYAGNGSGDMWQEEAMPILPDVIAYLEAKKVRTHADLGCGDGRNLRLLTEASFNCLGVDLSPTALARAAEVLERRCFLMQGDITALPLPDNSVDAVTCLDVFGQLPDPEAMITEAARILTPGGTLALTAYTHNDSEYGQGIEIAPHVFEYRNTMFRFFDEAEVRELFAEWTIERLDKVSWEDPPHGDFRPYYHTHENWVVYATPGS